MDSRGPMYRNIEFCRNAETLWEKLQSGNWDWLGVHPRGQFVLGSPRREGGVASSLSVKSVRQDAKEGVYGISYEIWSGTPGVEPGSEWFATAEEAGDRYKSILEELKNQRPLLAKVRLFEDKWVAEEEFIANSLPPNYQ